jgi:hypothetical protein
MLSRVRTFWLVVAIVGCATAEDPGGATTGSARDTGTAPIDSALVEDTEPKIDSSMTTTDSAAETSLIADSGTTDSGPSVDSTTAMDTEPVDTGTVVTDTGTVVTDTGTTVMCSESGKYGGKCKTNLDCAAIPGCGYVCCAYDPSGTISLGCGRISGGSFCLP